MSEITIPRGWMIPEGYELNEDSTEPVWFGPLFEDESFTRWRESIGHEVVVINGGEYIGSFTVTEARELRRILDGLINIIGESE